MNTSISKEIFKAGQKLINSAHSDAVSLLNQTLNNFLSWPFKAASGCVVDSQNRKTEIFDTLIFTTPHNNSSKKPIQVLADSTACIICVSENLDLEGFRAAYNHVSNAKKLKKSVGLQTNGIRYETLGIILATKASIPLENIAEELDRLNQQTLSSEWPDIVAVLSQGMISYNVQFPGEQTSCNFLLPGKSTAKYFPPAQYVVPVLAATGEYTFNNIFALLIGHLGNFSPGANLPEWIKIMEGVSNYRILLPGYQFNLDGNLVPVPPERYIGQSFPKSPLLIEDQQGNILSTLEFLPWQDGGVIIVNGKLPIEEILVFLGKTGLVQGPIVKLQNELQISPVLPISQTDFFQMVQNIRQRTNMIIRKPKENWIKQKFIDESVNSPFIARLFLGILTLRSQLQDTVLQESFDKIYEPLFMSLLNLRNTVNEINTLWSEHAKKISQGTIARIHNGSIEIDENINLELNKQVESFGITAARILKKEMQKITNIFNVNIGFLFGNQNNFQKELSDLEKFDSNFAIFLQQVRLWSEPLVDLFRNALEHKEWQQLKVNYSKTSDSIKIEEPTLLKQPVTQYVKFTLDRLMCFIEEVIVHCIQKKLPQGISLTEIPLSSRDTEKPLRFKVILTGGGMPIWNISYNQTEFEEK